MKIKMFLLTKVTSGSSRSIARLKPYDFIVLGELLTPGS